MTAHEIGFVIGALLTVTGIGSLLVTASESWAVFGGTLALAGIALILNYGVRRLIGSACFTFTEANFPAIAILLIAFVLVVVAIIDRLL